MVIGIKHLHHFRKIRHVIEDQYVAAFWNVLEKAVMKRLVCKKVNVVGKKNKMEFFWRSLALDRTFCFERMSLGENPHESLGILVLQNRTFHFHISLIVPIFAT